MDATDRSLLVAVAVALAVLAAFYFGDCLAAKRSSKDVERQLKAEVHAERAEVVVESADAAHAVANEHRDTLRSGEQELERNATLIEKRQRRNQVVDRADRVVRRLRALGYKSARVRR